jgi:hypothetical protein
MRSKSGCLCRGVFRKIQLPPPVKPDAAELSEDDVGFALPMWPNFRDLCCQVGIGRFAGGCSHSSHDYVPGRILLAVPRLTSIGLDAYITVCGKLTGLFVVVNRVGV